MVNGAFALMSTAAGPARSASAANARASPAKAIAATTSATTRIARAGEHVTLISFSIGVTYALAAAEELAKEGIEAEIIHLRTLRPFDLSTIIQSVKKTGRCVAIEEGWPQCGISSELAMCIQEEAFDYLDAPILRVTGKNVPMPYAANLEKLALPSIAEIIHAAKAVLYRN